MAKKKKNKESGLRNRNGTSSDKKEEYNELLKKRGAGESKMSKFLTRLVFGWVLIFAFYAVLYSAHVYIILMVVLLQIALFRELVSVRYDATKDKKIPLFRTIQWAWFGAAMFFIYGEGIIDFLDMHGFAHSPIGAIYVQCHKWIGFGIYSLLFAVTVLHLKKDLYAYQMGQLTWTLLAIMLMVAQLSRFVSLVTEGMFWFLLSCSLVVCNDTFAYFCGFSMGRKIIKRPFLELSPNKTWEGFLGGALVTFVFAFFWPKLWVSPWLICPLQEISFVPFQNNLSCEVPEVFLPTTYDVPSALQAIFGATITCLPVQWHSMALASYAAIFAPFGGFFASAVKRAYKVKDFDSLIPGHGGLMDRLDCQFIMLLCTSIHLDTFVRVASVSVASVLRSVSKLSSEDQQAVLDQLQAQLA